VSIAETIERQAVSASPWDAIVIGAGPAGAFAALRLAQAGRRVLLVEKREFPREKVCGGCISAQAVTILQAAGLGDLLAATEPLATTRLCLFTDKHRVSVPLPTGLAVSRSRLDAAIVQGAIDAGVQFLPQTTAHVGPISNDHRQVVLRGAEGDVVNARSELVIAADGLTASSLSSELKLRPCIATSAFLGLGAVIHAAKSSTAALGIEPGTIQMSITPDGYVGIAPCGPVELSVAAACSPEIVRQFKEPPAIIAHLLRTAGRDVWAEHCSSAWSTANWQGTPALTRRLEWPAAERLLVLGDAAGYVEPFTGEGVTAAVAAAEGLARLVARNTTAWRPGLDTEWVATYRQLIEKRQRLCRGLAWLLRSPRLVRAAMRVLTLAPSCSAPFVRYWNRPLSFARD